MIMTIKEFVDAWANESGATSKVIGILTDESLSQSVGDNYRTLGRIAWHLVQTIPEMMNQTGLSATGPGPDVSVPSSAAVLKSAYDSASKSLLDEVKSKWTDDSLMEEDELYGEKWKRSFTLGALIAHEIHHRGQMTVLMRQAGLKVPGIYGPSYEEWEQYGKQPPEI
jgi:uncharacterized damage-inducible protein DinB